MLNPNYLELLKSQLSKLATQANFETVLTTAFGNNIGHTKLFNLRQQWLTGDFSLIPPIDILTNGELGNANGGYAASEDKIFVSSDFLAQNHNNSNAVTGLLLEEFGHKLDRFFNGNIDSPGDEGEIFSRLARGETLSPQTLADLKAQDDHAVITVGGKLVAVEQQFIPGTNGDDNSDFVGGSDLLGTSDNDQIYGYAGNDYLSASGGNDILVGGAGDDILVGGTGNDTYIIDADVDFGIDTIYEFDAEGIDTLDFRSTTTQGIEVSLGYWRSGDPGQQIVPGVNLNIFASDRRIENVYGGSQHDIIFGSLSDNTLNGGAGDDTLYSFLGNDTLNGGAGDDYLRDGGVPDGDDYDKSGNDVLNGGAGSDQLKAYGGNDLLNGGLGYDFLDGGLGDDTYVIDADVDIGYDFLDEKVFNKSIGNYQSSNVGIDTLDFRTTTTRDISINLGETRTQTIAENVRLVMELAGTIENAYGGKLDDTIIGSNLDNILNGEAGDDQISGGVGNDILNGGVADSCQNI